jgi:HD-like signal output (HDOD) protein/ActR/RegA family two-component response regulator
MLTVPAGGERRVLFVDDEASILESLRDALRPWRREWKASFCCGGEEALERLRRETFDVVVSDMRMPGVDGTALLRGARDLQPHAVRILLSGSTERDVVARAAAVAHRLLAKPCDVDKLAGVVSRAAALGERSRVRSYEAVSGATALPCAPALYRELSDLLATETAGVADVARVIECDVAVTGKLLQLTNSAFIGLPRTIVRVEEAVNLLGVGVVKAVVLSTHALSAYHPARPIPGFSIEALERHASAVAALTRRMLPAGPTQQLACTAAMLQDVGWLVLAAEDPDRLGEVVSAAASQRSPLDVAERELGGPTHAELGAHLLALWDLPDPIVAAVAHHHTPPLPTEPGLDVVAAVHIAGALVSGDAGADVPAPEYLEAVSVADRLDEWRSLAAAHADVSDQENPCSLAR